MTARSMDGRDHRGAGGLEILLANHRDLLAFVERRVDNRAAAEDLLQNAFVRVSGRLTEVREESTLAWFYRVLRNAVVDHYRRRAAEERALDTLAVEINESEPPAEWKNAACRCVLNLAATLKPEYAEALKRIDIEGASVASYADEVGITAGNAGVRVFRARAALRKQVERSCRTCATHGCLDCTCTSTAA